MIKETAVRTISHPMSLLNHPRALIRCSRRAHRQAPAYAPTLTGVRLVPSVPGARRVRRPLPIVRRSIALERLNSRTSPGLRGSTHSEKTDRFSPIILGLLMSIAMWQVWSGSGGGLLQRRKLHIDASRGSECKGRELTDL